MLMTIASNTQARRLCMAMFIVLVGGYEMGAEQVLARDPRSLIDEARQCRDGSVASFGFCVEDLEEGPSAPATIGRMDSALMRAVEIALGKARKSQMLAQKAADRANTAAQVADRAGTTISYSNGKYAGEIVRGIRHGYGVYTFASGEKYEGQWFEGDWTGYARWSFKGAKYEGEWEIDRSQIVTGAREFPDGTRYIGELKRIRPNGRGVLYSSDGSVKQQGVWDNGKYQGASGR